MQDDGGGSPMEQDNGDGDETAKIDPPKPVNYEPRQVHVSGFSLVVSATVSLDTNCIRMFDIDCVENIVIC